jgi:hypothetical protein
MHTHHHHSHNMVIGCSSCSHQDCPLSDPSVHSCTEGHQVISGWLFSLACSIVFLLPIAFAITGSVILRADHLLGLLGGVSGFILGWAISTCLARYFAISRS